MNKPSVIILLERSVFEKKTRFQTERKDVAGHGNENFLFSTCEEKMMW